MYITLDNPERGVSPFLYENLSDDNLRDPFDVTDLNYFCEVLNQFGITLPDAMIEQLIADQESNVVGKAIDFTAATATC